MAPLEVEIYKELYQSAKSGNYDIYVVFIERGLKLLNANGRLGFICPHKFFNAQYGEPLRRVVTSGQHLSHVVHFGDEQVFDGATTYTCLLFLSKTKADWCRLVKPQGLFNWRATEEGTEGLVANASLNGGEWNFSIGTGADLYEKLALSPITLACIAERIGQGIRTSANEVYVLDVVKWGKEVLIARSAILECEVEIERTAVCSFLQGREIKAYRLLASGKVVIAPYTISDNRATLIREVDIRHRLPLLHKYLIRNKDYLSAREKGRFRGPDWYQYGRSQNIDMMLLPKILVPDIADRASFALDEGGNYAFTSGYGITLREEVSESPKYVLGLLNSSLLDFYLKRISTTLRGGFFRYFTQFIEKLPIRRIDFENQNEKAIHDRMVALVDSMLVLHKQLTAAKSESQKGMLQRQIDATDAEIDRLVYELYGLTEEEIKIVEGERGT